MYVLIKRKALQKKKSTQTLITVIGSLHFRYQTKPLTLHLASIINLSRIELQAKLIYTKSKSFVIMYNIREISCIYICRFFE